VGIETFFFKKLYQLIVATIGFAEVNGHSRPPCQENTDQNLPASPDSVRNNATPVFALEIRTAEGLDFPRGLLCTASEENAPHECGDIVGVRTLRKLRINPTEAPGNHRRIVIELPRCFQKGRKP
jgi:hypothetical protein